MKKQMFFFILSLTSNYTKCAELTKNPSLSGDSGSPCKEEVDDLVEHLKLSLLISSKIGKLARGIYYFKAKGRLFTIDYHPTDPMNPLIKIEEISENFFEGLRISGSFVPDWLSLSADLLKTKRIARQHLKGYQGPKVIVVMLPAARERETSPEPCSSSCCRTTVRPPSPKRARK